MADKLRGTLADLGSIKGTLADGATITGRLYVPEIITPPIYSGPVTITPTRQAQTLETGGTMLNENITVEAIPNNYGLITYNGGIITVS